MKRCPTPEQRKRATEMFANHHGDGVISIEPIEPTGTLTCSRCGYSDILPLKMIGWICNQRMPHQPMYEGCKGVLRL